MPLSPFLYGLRTEAAGGHTIIVRIHGVVASTILFNSALWV